MILVCHDPAMAAFERHKIDLTKTWGGNLFSLFPLGLDARDWELMLNDKVIVTEALNLDAFPLPCDRLIMRNRPLGIDPISWVYIAVAAAAAALAVTLATKQDFGYEQTSSKSKIWGRGGR